MTNESAIFPSSDSLVLGHCGFEAAHSNESVGCVKAIKGDREMKPRYNRKGWLLCECAQCRRQNYVEPHGTTAFCPSCSRKKENQRVWADASMFGYPKGTVQNWVEHVYKS
jgi:hypothetical protein